MIKVLAKEFNEQFTCLGEDTEKYITFTVRIEKKLQELIKMEKKLQEVCYILQFIDSIRFMASSSNLVNNLSVGIDRIKCKFRHDKKYEICGIKY